MPAMAWRIVWVLAAVVPMAQARVITVGPGGEFARIADAARNARNGDTVEIAPGLYRGDVAKWTQDDLVIRGTGDGVVLEADGASIEGKAIWVIRGRRVTVSRVTFSGARVPDGNGAGIRLERGSLDVRECRFLGNQVGLLTGNDASIELRVNNSEFSDAMPSAHSLPHLIYVGAIDRVTIEGSRFSRGQHAHLIKSRARESRVAYNIIDDGPQGAAAYELEFPSGGKVTVLGNVIGQSAGTTNPVMLAYGAEGYRWPVNMLDVYHNTFVSRGWMPAWFVRVWHGNNASTAAVRLVNNLVLGTGLLATGARAEARGNHFTWPWLRVGDAADTLRLSPETRPAVQILETELALKPVSEPVWPVGKRGLEIGLEPRPGALQVPASPGAGVTAWRLP